MELRAPTLNFPRTFCCNCGNTDCRDEVQDTRVTRLGFGGTETRFQLTIPICAACLKTTRRRPAAWYWRVAVFVVTTAVLFWSAVFFGAWSTWPSWIGDHLLLVSAAVSLALVTALYALRRPLPPQSSYYQPVRIRAATVNFGEGFGELAFVKLAFTHPQYLNLFVAANQEAIQARRVAVVKARS